MTEGAPGVEEEVRELCRRRVDRIRRREADAMVDEFYAEDARLLPAGEDEVSGRAAVLEWWRERPEAGLVNLNLETERVEGGERLAYEIGRFTRTVRPRHGPPRQEHGKYLVVYRRGEEGLRAMAEIYNSD